MASPGEHLTHATEIFQVGKNKQAMARASAMHGDLSRIDNPYGGNTMRYVEMY